MTRSSIKVRQPLGEERGQALVEYALILALVSLAAIVSLGFLSGKINELFSKAGNSLNTVAVADGSGTGSGPGTGTGGGSAPATPLITAGPVPDSSGSSAAFTSPTFQFTGDGTQTSFECSLDSAPFTTCTSPQSYSSLGVGPHSFGVQASNGSGTSAPATRNWTVTLSGSIPTPGTISTFDCPGDGVDCDNNDLITATTSGWNTNGQPITSYRFEWATKDDSSSSSCTLGTWVVVETDTGAATTQTYQLPDNIPGSGDANYRVTVYATNAIGESTDVARACTIVDD